jgi:hypothetical protein
MNANSSLVSTDGHLSPVSARRFVRALLMVAIVLGIMAGLGPLEPAANPVHAASEACAPGPHSGTISASQEWCLADSPHVVNGGVTVASGATLTVEAGVEVRFNSGTLLTLGAGATLLAEGTDVQIVTFTANTDSPTPGSWGYLYFQPGSHASLAYCDLGYAGQSGHPTLYVDASDVQLSHCTIHDSLADAIHVRGAGLAPTFADLTLVNNGARAVYQNTVDMTPTYSNLTVSGNGTNAIVSLGGSLTRNATLAVTGSVDGATLPYIWLGSVTVTGGYTLTIDPAVELRLTSGFVLDVQPNATVLAEGTPTQPITFTANLATPVPGSWAYFILRSGSHASLAHCDLGYAGQSSHPALYVDSSDVQMEFCRVHDNLDEGLEVRSSAQPLLHFNRIEDNGFGLRNDTPLVPVDARQNWWGDASGPYHPTLNPGGLGDQVSDGVLFDPWLGPYAYVWKEPDAYLLHGKEMLSWFEFAAGEPAARSVGITTVTGGQTYTLGLGLPTIGELAWDTTGYPDGLHELHALFRNGEGQVIADIAKTIAVNNSPAIAWHGGRLTANETWNASKVHVVEKDLFIPASVTLTVEPRAIVKFERGAGITVEDGGTLATPATDAEPIVFTSLADDSAGGDTNMDGDYTLPIAGDWRGIAVQGAGQFFWNQYVELRYVLVTHSGTLSADQTWYGHALHRITGNLIIPAGVTLTILVPSSSSILPWAASSESP